MATHSADLAAGNPKISFGGASPRNPGVVPYRVGRFPNCPIEMRDRHRAAELARIQSAVPMKDATPKQWRAHRKNALAAQAVTAEMVDFELGVMQRRFAGAKNLTPADAEMQAKVEAAIAVNAARKAKIARKLAALEQEN